MRALSLLLIAGVLLAATTVQAEQRIFIIANNADGYGVDRCLAGGLSCGQAVAAAFCRARDFAEVLTFRRIERAEITGAVTSDTPVCRGLCEDLIAIECRR